MGEELTKLTQMLCSTLRIVEAADARIIMQLPQDTQTWWTIHRRLDREREERERKEASNKRERDAALKKLTKRERKVLGL